MHVTRALVATVALTLVACGGGRTHRGFVDEAADICRQANARFAGIDVVRPSAAQADAALGDIIEIGALALQDLRRVKPPKGDQTAVNAWLGTLEQALDEVAYRANAAARRRDPARRRRHRTGRRADATARVLARALGLERVCEVPELLPGQ